MLILTGYRVVADGRFGKLYLKRTKEGLDFNPHMQGSVTWKKEETAKSKAALMAESGNNNIVVEPVYEIA